MVLHAPAKINWFLKVLNRRPDGYHNIFSLMQKISLYDILSFEKNSTGAIEVVCNIDSLNGEQNIVFKAARVLQQWSGVKTGAKIVVTKNIPLEAGLGGGSSDAATALIGLNRLWSLNLDTSVLATLCGSIGSDVCFFLFPSLAVVKGKGDVVIPVKGYDRRYWLLVVKPPFGIKTRDAYSRVRPESMKAHQMDSLLEQAQMALKGDTEALKRTMQNDLERVALELYPELLDVKKQLLQAGAVSALLAGSGSAMFGVFLSEQDAKDAATGFTHLKDYKTFLCHTL